MHTTPVITAVVLLVSLHCACADTKVASPSQSPRSHRSTGNVEFIPSVSRSLPSSRVQFPSHYFDRNTPALSVRHAGPVGRSHQPRRVAHGKLPPYAVQMEPLVQYSQRDPLQPSGDKDTISKKFSSGPGIFVNHHGTGNQVSQSPYQHQIFVTPQPHLSGESSNNYYGSSIPPGYIIIREPEPIIEIIVREANHTLPHPPTTPSPPRTKEPVHVFYVKYKKDEHGNGVQYEKPVPAVTPATPLLTSSPEEYPVYTPLTTSAPPHSTTLRTVIHPDSETVHVNTGGLRITFGEEGHSPSEHQDGNHGHHEHQHGHVEQQQQQQDGPHEHHHVEGSDPQPTFVKPAPSSSPPHSQPSKRQQPSLAPTPRFNAAPFQQTPQQFNNAQFQPSSTQSRFLSPPPVQNFPSSGSQEFRSQQQPQFASTFTSVSQDRPTNFQQFNQRPSFGNTQQRTSSRIQPQFTGKLEQVAFQQPSTGKLEPVPFQNSGRFESSQFSQQPSFQQLQQQKQQQQQFRLQEPVNGLPPPPPPQNFQRQQSPTFFSHQSQFSHPSRQPAQARPLPQGFSQPLASVPQQSPSFPQPSQSQQTEQPPTFSQQPIPFAPQQAPKFSQPLPPPQQPSFSGPSFTGPSFSGPSFSSPQQQFSGLSQPSVPFNPTFVPPFSPFPSTTASPRTTQQNTRPASAPTQQPPSQSFDSEIVQSLSPSTEELKFQQQEQFHKEQQYYQEIQKIQQEVALRAAQKAQSTTSAPIKKTTSKQSQFAAAAPSTTTTTEAPRSASQASSAPNLNNFILPDEVPEELRQQLLSSGILNNADIQILDYDKVGDIPIESLPQEALQQFLGAGGGSAAGAASAPVPQVVPAPVDRVSSGDDTVEAASDNVESTAAPGPVEVKVVRYQPGGEAAAASKIVRKDATTLDPVVLDDASYSRYLPLQVAGAWFPLPDQLRGLNVTSVVVLAPVAAPLDSFARRTGNVESASEEEVHFVAGPVLKQLVKQPTEDNFRRWLDVENATAADKQSVILLVMDKPSGSSESEDKSQDIFMYDVSTRKVNRLDGELSSAFVEVALANSSVHEVKAATSSAPASTSSSSSSALPSNHSPTHAKAPSKDAGVSISSSYSKTKQ